MAQDTGWVALSYQTQGPNYATYVTFGTSQNNSVTWPTPPILAAPANDAQGVPAPIVFSWNGVTTATAYQLQVAQLSGFSSTVYNNAGITSTSQTVSGLAYSTSYYWRVQATNGSSWTGWSSVNSFTTGIAPPAAPALSSPANNAQNQLISLSLSWQTAATATSYGYQVSTASNFATTVVNGAGLTATSASISGLAASSTYYWEANAVNAGGIGAWSGVWSFTTMALPAAPALSSPTNGATTSKSPTVTASWGTVSGALSYNFQLSANSGFTSYISNQTGLTATTATATISSTTMYWWHVSSTNAVGTGAWSAAWSFTTPVSVQPQATMTAAAVRNFTVRNGVIAYKLAAPGEVKISVENMLGRTELAINRTQTAGSYAVDLKQSKLVSGKYLVRLKTARFEKVLSVTITR